MEKRKVLGISALLVSLASLGFVSAAFNVQSILNDWANIGVFSYILPFLLIFALVYGILAKISLFGDNKAVNAIVALALGGLSLVGDFVPRFFQTIAPNLGIALSILLAVIILLGLFMSKEFEAPWVKFIIIGVAIIAFIGVVFSSFSGYPQSIDSIWAQYGPSLITLLIIGGIIWMIVSGGKKA